MNRILTVIIIALFISNCAQNNSNNLLSPEIIEIKKPSTAALNEILLIENQFKLYSEEFTNEFNKYFEVNGDPIGFDFSSTKQFKLVKSYVLSDEELIVRQFAALKISDLWMKGVQLQGIESELKNVCLEIMPPDDIMWSVNTEETFYTKNAILIFGIFHTENAIQSFVDSSSILQQMTEEDKNIYINNNIGFEAAYNYRKSIYLNNSNRIVKASALSSILDLLYGSKKFSRANVYYHILLNDYLDIDGIKESISQYNPNKNTKIGNPVPAFEAIDAKSLEHISPSSLIGKYYLIQFWSTSCGPCIAEMEELHQIYDNYKDKNFTIVSICLGDPIDVVKRFWKEKWTMPWHNVLLSDGWENSIAKSFEVKGIPNLVLLNPEGNIIENNDSFRNEKIEKIVSNYLEP